MYRINECLLKAVFLLGLICFSYGNKKIEENYKEALKLQQKHALIPLNLDLFNRLARGPSRNFTMFVLFTANAPSRGCQACQMVHGEITVVGNSMHKQLRYSTSPQPVFLGLIDFDGGSDVFQLMRLQSAPVLYRFSPSYVRGKEETCDFNRYGISAEGLARFIYEKSNYQIKIEYPPDYSKLTAVVGMVTLIGLIAYLKPAWFTVFIRPPFWSVVVLAFVFSMLSGQMWNHIRSPPFSQRQQDGSVQYFSHSSGSQVVAETYIVAALYALITLGFILLGDTSKWLRRPLILRKYFNVCGLALFAFVFGYLLSVFRTKYGGYPYSFIF